MISRTAITSNDPQILRRGINDLVSLLALPAIWSGREPAEILKTMADSLLSMLRLEFIYGRVTGSSGDLRLEAGRVSGQQKTAEEIRLAFESCLQDGTPSSTLILRNPIGEGEMRVSRFSIGLSEEIGLVIAGSQRPDFPNQMELILLQVCVNQAAIAIDNARLFEQVQQERAKAELMQGILSDRVHEMEKMMEVMPVGLLLSLDSNAKQIVGNRAAREFLRIGQAADSNLSLSAPGDTAPAHFRVCKDGRDIPAEHLPMQRASKQGIAVPNEELDIVFNDQVVKHARVSALPLFDQNGVPRGAVASILDITDQKKAELEREQHLQREKSLRSEAESANTLKDEFLATISHELRTPLNAMLGWARILRTNKVDENIFERAMEAIERSARTQARLIEDLLDVSRIISGKMRLDVQPVDLVPVVQSAVESVRPAAEAKLLRLQVILDPAAGPVSGDPTRLQQIVWNLLSNAIKFTQKEGSIQIRLERVNSHIEIIVSDTGIGIPQSFLPFIFDRFRQADSSISRSQPGLGLGLSIVRHLVELHGGEVQAYSKGEGQGATFIVKLPLLIVRDLEFPPESLHRDETTPFDCPPALNGLRILVVDDELDARDLMITILRRCNAVVCAVATPSEGFQALEEFKPDVLVSDIQMPGEDGFSFIQKVRQKERSNERIPAAALTAHAGLEHRMRALSAGFDIHLPKPVEPAELIAVIASLASRISRSTNR